ncbi:2286_t:CDS:2 [Gigaspora rosea]|nr:2286_t:CDS:2 [Gigaspora rosea]
MGLYGFLKSQVVNAEKFGNDMVSYYLDIVIQMEKIKRITYPVTGDGTGMPLNQNMQILFENLEADAHEFDSRTGYFQAKSLARLSALRYSRYGEEIEDKIYKFFKYGQHSHLQNCPIFEHKQNVEELMKLYHIKGVGWGFMNDITWTLPHQLFHMMPPLNNLFLEPTFYIHQWFLEKFLYTAKTEQIDLFKFYGIANILYWHESADIDMLPIQVGYVIRFDLVLPYINRVIAIFTAFLRGLQTVRFSPQDSPKLVGDNLWVIELAHSNYFALYQDWDTILIVVSFVAFGKTSDKPITILLCFYSFDTS